jgi:CRP-like cAMP-binding protein
MSTRPNRLLQALEPAVLTRFEPRLRRVEVQRGQVQFRPGEEIQDFYFHEGALIGLLSAMPGGDTVQTAMVGWDGALGVFEACGSRQSAFLAEVQVAGAARRIDAETYRKLYEDSRNLRTAVHKCVEMLLTEARQFVACNALHSVESRLSRSVLEALERSGHAHVLPATQQTLAEMLGVQRTTVTAAISHLQALGALHGTRGQLEVLDRRALEQAACCCRETVRAARAQIYAADADVCDD